jgi:hypothetical protein
MAERDTIENYNGLEENGIYNAHAKYAKENREESTRPREVTKCAFIA